MAEFFDPQVRATRCAIFVVLAGLRMADGVRFPGVDPQDSLCGHLATPCAITPVNATWGFLALNLYMSAELVRCTILGSPQAIMYELFSRGFHSPTIQTLSAP
ncbi:hypothetical protein An18g00350 [Aspergillus niger]|uniref:Uncharacterized protein n=2 Tax=Aspergillus niger TaxID=5061 RepID=A2R9V5_ASPNC|nr:hypothetical protein An18g00350 [Aspergillus niger]CAK43111.1 hypothetical protein An18g00350 [Aspergillus niger]